MFSYRSLLLVAAGASLLACAPGGETTSTSTAALDARPGERDASWGSGGEVVLAEASANADLGDVVALPGNELAAVASNERHEVIVSRFDANGTPVARFGVAGVTKPSSASTGKPYRAGGVSAFQPSLRIAAAGARLLVATETDSSEGIEAAGVPIRVVALDVANGSIDRSFGEAGETSARLGTRMFSPSALTVTSDGGLLVAGFVGNPHRWDTSAIARFDMTGAFRSDASTILDFTIGPPTLGVRISAVFDTPGGGVLALGDRTVHAGEHQDDEVQFAALRDRNATTFAPLEHGALIAAAKAADGSIYALTDDADNGSSLRAPRIAHLDADGALHSSFGVAVTCAPQRIALRPDGGMYIASLCDDGLVSIARLTSAGDLETAFGNAGIARTDLSMVGRLLYETDGKLVISGRGRDGTHVAVLRLHG